MFKSSYGEYIFQQLITTEFVQDKLSLILIAIAVNIVQMHIASILCILLTINQYVDFFIQIGISVTIAVNVSYVYDFVERYKKEFMVMAQYILQNFSIENYRYWKRMVVITIAVYACIILSVVKITNQLLFLYIFQYVICFLIIEQFEQNRIKKWINDYKTRPTIHKSIDPSATLLVESYYHPNEKIIKKIIVPSGKIVKK